jgi:hypothetical protein
VFFTLLRSTFLIWLFTILKDITLVKLNVPIAQFLANSWMQNIKTVKMKSQKSRIILLCVCTFLFLTESCNSDKSCPTVDCNAGVYTEECYCECPTGFSGVRCENLDTSLIQTLLNDGVSPKILYDGGATLDQLYGKTFGGGVLFYLNIGSGTGLIAATEDLTTSPTWGCEGFEIPGADGAWLEHGAQNTRDILHNCKEAGIAAKLCRDLVFNDKDDWFLPSIHELRVMRIRLADSDGDGINSGINDPGNIGRFTTGYYWSSTEYSEGWAVKLKFDAIETSHAEAELKSQKTLVRPVRAF